MAADGSLTNVANVTDDSALELDRAIGVTTVAMNGQIHVIVARQHRRRRERVHAATTTSIKQPTLTATGNNPTFTEGGAAADLFSAPVASTIEPGQTFTSLTLTVTNVTDGANEILSFLGHDLALTDGNSVAGVTVSVVGTTATVTFPGAADAAALQQLIDGLAYRNTSQNPTERRPRRHHHAAHRLGRNGGRRRRHRGADHRLDRECRSRPTTRRSSAATRPASHRGGRGRQRHADRDRQPRCGRRRQHGRRLAGGGGGRGEHQRLRHLSG